MSGKSSDAYAFLSKEPKQMRSDVWVTSVTRFLQKEIREADLVAAADIPPKLTSAHAYIGLNSLVSGDKEKAIKSFRWVVSNGVKTSQEFLMATIILRRIDGSKEK